MSPGDVVLIRLPVFAGTGTKLRPALYLASLPGPYQTLLLCGISTQLAQILANWDELIQNTDSDFSSSGLHQPSMVRLSYLYAADPSEISGILGNIDLTRLDRLRERLADQIRPLIPQTSGTPP